jgi:hypothetical protein
MAKTSLAMAPHSMDWGARIETEKDDHNRNSSAEVSPSSPLSSRKRILSNFRVLARTNVILRAAESATGRKN